MQYLVPQIEDGRGRTRRTGTLVMLALTTLAAATVAGCGPPQRDVNDAHNSRDTGQYQVVGRQSHDDGTVVLHVVAQEPEHGRAIAENLVVQNYPLSPTAVRVIVDPAAGGDRQAYRWDTSGLRVDTSPAAGPAPAPAPRTGAEGGGAAH